MKSFLAELIWILVTTGLLVFLLLVIFKLKNKVTNKKILKLVLVITIASVLLDYIAGHMFSNLLLSLRLGYLSVHDRIQIDFFIILYFLYYLIQAVIFFIILYFLTRKYWNLDKKTALKFSIPYSITVLVYRCVSFLSILCPWFGSPIIRYINNLKYELLRFF